jgi:hypothetical protein
MGDNFVSLPHREFFRRGAATRRGAAGRAAGGSLMPRVLDLHVAPALCVPVEFAMLNP